MADNWLVTWAVYSSSDDNRVAIKTNIFSNFISTGYPDYTPVQNSISFSLDNQGTYDVVGYLGSTLQTNIDREITLSPSLSCMPLIPLEDRPLKSLSFFDLNLIHFPNLELSKIS